MVVNVIGEVTDRRLWVRVVGRRCLRPGTAEINEKPVALLYQRHVARAHKPLIETDRVRKGDAGELSSAADAVRSAMEPSERFRNRVANSRAGGENADPRAGSRRRSAADALYDRG